LPLAAFPAVIKDDFKVGEEHNYIKKYYEGVLYRYRM
jgi:hypothetical protein